MGVLFAANFSVALFAASEAVGVRQPDHEDDVCGKSEQDQGFCESKAGEIMQFFGVGVEGGILADFGLHKEGQVARYMGNKEQKHTEAGETCQEFLPDRRGKSASQPAQDELLSSRVGSETLDTLGFRALRVAWIAQAPVCSCATYTFLLALQVALRHRGGG